MSKKKIFNLNLIIFIEIHIILNNNIGKHMLENLFNY